MVPAVLQHVSRPRQPLEDVGGLLNRQFLYPFLLHHCHKVGWVGCNVVWLFFTLISLQGPALIRGTLQGRISGRLSDRWINTARYCGSVCAAVQGGRGFLSFCNSEKWLQRTITQLMVLNDCEHLISCNPPKTKIDILRSLLVFILWCWKWKENASHDWGFLLTFHIWQRWTWQISEITLS